MCIDAITCNLQKKIALNTGCYGVFVFVVFLTLPAFSIPLKSYSYLFRNFGC
jgi:hypothetical protein